MATVFESPKASVRDFSIAAAAPAQWKTLAAVIVTDVFILAVVYWLAVVGRHFVTTEYHWRPYLMLFPAVEALLLLAFAMVGLYPGVSLHPAEEIRRVVYALTTVFLSLSSVTFLLRSAEAYSRSIFIVTWAIGIPAMLLARSAARRSLARTDWWGISAIVMGSSQTANAVIEATRSHPLGLRVVGFLREDENPQEVCKWPVPDLGTLADAPQLALDGIAQYAIIAMPGKPSSHLSQVIRDFCCGFRHVLVISDLAYGCTLGLTVHDIGGGLGIEVPQRLFHSVPNYVKRALDLIGSAALLCLLSPVFLFVAILVKLTSPGPVFYGQTRQGREGKEFKAHKFRTMIRNGDELLRQHFERHPEDLAEWQKDHKLKSDPRITVCGTWLRRYSIDELPQLWNVLTGEMSLVGPRPIVKEEISKYGPTFGLYKRVRPGITGLWQVSGRNDTTYETRVDLDEFYVRNWSVWLDAYILVRTVRVVLTASGAY